MKTPQVGELLGRYRLIERIGAGGMAEVFLARLEGPAGFARKVAIKVVLPNTDDDEHLLDLVDEARVAGLLRHPNIVQVHELEKHGDGFYLVMEYLDGRPLDQMLRAGRMASKPPKVEAVIDVGLQVLDALGYAHTARDDGGNALELVHRDIKPSNLMVSDRGVVTVVDFGIARAANLERRTASGMGKGTPAYMAPEQLRGAPVGPSSDLFGLGTLMFEMATGKRLFDAGSLAELIYKRQVGVTTEEAALVEAVHPGLARVILRALAQDPAERYQTAAAMAAALRPLSDAHPQEPLRGWAAAIRGSQPVSTTMAVTRAVSVGVMKPQSGSGPEPRWVEGAPQPGVAPTRLLDGAPDDTRAMAPNGTPAPSSPRRFFGLSLFAAALLLIGGVAWFVIRGGTAAEVPLPGAVAPTPSPDVDALSEPPAPTPMPVPEATPQAAPEPPRAPPAPAPAPAPAPTPAPSPAATPDASVPAVASSGTAMAEVFLNVIGSGGQVEIVGRGRRATPTTYRIPPGQHLLRLLDQNNGTLAEFTLAVGAGEEARCLWKRDGSKLKRLADPDGAPCDVR